MDQFGGAWNLKPIENNMCLDEMLVVHANKAASIFVDENFEREMLNEDVEDKFEGHKNRAQVELQPLKCPLTKEQLVEYLDSGFVALHFEEDTEIFLQSSNILSREKLAFVIISTKY